MGHVDSPGSSPVSVVWEVGHGGTWSSPVSAVWEVGGFMSGAALRGSYCFFLCVPQDPEGNLSPSSSFQDGYFILDLPEERRAGNYHCQLNLSSTAVGCLPSDSRLRDKSEVGVSIKAAPSTRGLWL